MKKPWWRKQNSHWYLETPAGQVRLSKKKDPDGGERKHPPQAVEDAWHKLAREGVPQDMRVSDLFEKFKETVTHPDLAAVTKGALDKFEEFVGGSKKVLDLKPNDLTRYLKTKEHWKPSTVRTFVNRIHAALNWGAREGLVDRNPISSVKGYKRQGRFERRRGVVSAADMKTAEEKSPAQFRDFLIALRETGARPGELRRARIEKADLDAGFMLVPNKTARQTGEAERKIYLSEAAKEVMRGRIGTRKEGFVFLSVRGKPWTHDALKKRWWNLKQVHGLKGTLYSYRHGFVSKAINERDVNPAIVAQLVGHSGLEVLLKHYLEEDPEALKRALEKITGEK